jgi:hypothetical protein
MMYTREAIGATLDSYRAALDKVFGMSDHVEFHGSGSAMDLYMPMSLRAGDVKVYAALTTRISVERGRLFDGPETPLLVRSSWHTWTSSFLRVTAWVDVPFVAYEHQPERFDETGESEPATLRSSIYYVQVCVCERIFGLMHWRTKHEEIAGLMDGATPDIAYKYARAVEAADKEIKRWEDAIRNLQTVEIPA